MKAPNMDLPDFYLRARPDILATLKTDVMQTIPEIVRKHRMSNATLYRVLVDGPNDHEFYVLQRRDENGNGRLEDLAFSKRLPDTPMFIDVHVKALGMHDPIERVVRVAGDTTYVQMHFILQRALGFKNLHAFNFYFGNPDGTDEEILQFTDEELDETVLSGIAQSHDESLVYAYDFSDQWVFLLRVINVGSQTADIIVPDLLAAKNANAPEGCGGRWGYEQLRIAVSNGRKDSLRDVRNHFDYMLCKFSDDVNFKSLQRRVRSSLGWLDRTLKRRWAQPVALGRARGLDTRPTPPPLLQRASNQ